MPSQSTHAKGPTAIRWRSASAKGSDELAATIIADCVDETIFQLLRAIDNEDLNLINVASNGRTVDSSKEGLGELAGWFIGGDGWREMFSKRRVLR